MVVNSLSKYFIIIVPGSQRRPVRPAAPDAPRRVQLAAGRVEGQLSDQVHALEECSKRGRIRGGRPKVAERK